jgi:hypothetical protein
VFTQLLVADAIIGQKIKLCIGTEIYETPEVCSTVVSLCIGSSPDLSPLFARPLTPSDAVLLTRLASMPHNFVTAFSEQARQFESPLWFYFFSLRPFGQLPPPRALLRWAEDFVGYYDSGYTINSDQEPAHGELLRSALSMFYGFGLFGPISVLRAPVNRELLPNRPDLGAFFADDSHPPLPLDLPFLSDPELFQANISFVAKFALYRNPIVWLYAYQAAFHRTFVRCIDEFMDKEDSAGNDEFPDGAVVEIVQARLRSTKGELTRQTRKFFCEFALRFLRTEEARDQLWEICRVE